MTIQTTTDTDSWRSAASRGLRWLQEFCDDRLCVDPQAYDINWCAKLPWVFAACGDRERAVRVLNVVSDYFIVGQRIVEPSDKQWTNAISYALGWLVSGACEAQEHGHAKQLYESMKRYICEDHGGQLSDADSSSRESQYFDAAIQGALLHASLKIMDTNAVLRAGQLACDLIMNQPRSNEAFFTHYHPENGYLETPNNGQKGRYAFHPSDSPQPYANIGFMMQGLCHLHDATGLCRFLDAAQWLMDWLYEFCEDDLLSHGQNHKVAHAAAMLFRQTGNSRHKSIFIHMTERTAMGIDQDGRALADVWNDSIDKQSLFATVRTTCDSVLWLQAIIAES